MSPMLAINTRRLFFFLALLLLVASSIVSTFLIDSTKEGSAERRLSSQYMLLDVKQGDVVFVGDDVVAEGLWGELLPDLPVRNRGLSGQTSDELLASITALVEPGPAHLVINIGANDALRGYRSKRTLANIRELINLSRAISPGTEVVICSVLPLNGENSDTVISLNRKLEQLAMLHKATFVDIAALLLDAQGNYRPDLADRRMRLLGSAYAAWRDLLRPSLSNSA